MKPYSILLLMAGALMAFAENPPAERNLKDGQKQEVRYSMIGPRSTLLFYTFAAESAVLRLQIGNQDTRFPVTGTVLLFAPGTTGEDIAKWVNNQHSDGLFVDVPEPTLTSPLPEGVCTVAKVGLRAGEKPRDMHGAVYDDIEVALTVKPHRVEGQFALAGFKETTGVFVKAAQ